MKRTLAALALAPLILLTSPAHATVERQPTPDGVGIASLYRAALSAPAVPRLVQAPESPQDEVRDLLRLQRHLVSVARHRAAQAARRAAAAAALASPPVAVAADWAGLADCESGDRTVPGSADWGIANGNGFYGGLQITKGTWDAFGGDAYASYPNLATRGQQIAVGARILIGQGRSAWPASSAAGCW